MPSLSDKQKSYSVISGVVIFNILIVALAAITFHHSPAALSLALLAYLFGLRHAVDADHIAAIDNATRKLTNEGKSAFTSGLWFSLGHASVVIIACLIVAFTTSPLQQMFPGLKEIGALVSTFISGAFLLILAFANSQSVWNALRQRRQLKRAPVGSGPLRQTGHPHHGLLTRLCQPLFKLVSQSHHLFLIGFLFGIGFDTATEVAIFGMSASHAAGGETLLHIMIMPLLFTAGMMLIDSMDGVMMLNLYKWSQFDSLRSLNYTIAISSLSITVAAAIGLYEVSTLFHLDAALAPTLAAMMEGAISEMGWVLIATSLAVWLYFYSTGKRRVKAAA